MTINNGILPNGKQQFIDSNGNPLASGKVYYYIPSTTTFKTTYLDDAGVNANTNPIVLDSNGQCIADGSGSYRQQVYDVNNNLIWDVQIDSPITLSQIESIYSASNGSSLIGYNQGGTGAINTTVQFKLQQSVSVKDFGAIGNGTNDDTSAIQAAVNASNSVYFPDGTYLISSSITVNSNNNLYGNGIVKSNASIPLFTITGTSSTQLQNITFNGLQFVGVWPYYAIQAYSVNNLTVTKCRCSQINLLQTVDSVSYSSFTTANSATNLIITNNYGLSTTATATTVQFIRLLYAIKFTVADNVATGYGDGCLAYGGDANTNGAYANTRKCYAGTITGNVFDVLNAGIWCSMANDIVISNNVIKNCGQEAMDAEGCNRILFEGNICENVTQGMNIYFLNTDITFKNNVISLQSTSNANYPGGVAFYNGNTSYTGDYANIGTINLIGNTIRNGSSGIALLAFGTTGRLFVEDNDFLNVYCNSYSTGSDNWFNNTFNFNVTVPSGQSSFIYTGNLVTGFNQYSNEIPKAYFINNNILWSGSGITNTRAVFLGGGSVSSQFVIENNYVARFNTAFFYGGNTGSFSGKFKNNTFDVSIVYPYQDGATSPSVSSILYWIDNYNGAGQDFIGSLANASAQSGVWRLAVGSRIWNNTPASGSTPGWVITSTSASPTLTAMANLQ